MKHWIHYRILEFHHRMDNIANWDNEAVCFFRFAERAYCLYTKLMQSKDGKI